MKQSKRNAARFAAALLAALMLLLAGCAQSASPAAQPADTTRTAEAPAAQPTPEPTPQSESEPEPADYSEAYAAYLDVLTGRRADILSYDWQKGTYYDAEERFEVLPCGDTAQVALADVWGDETPELLYMDALTHENFRYSAQLHIVTFENGEAHELELSDGLNYFDGQVGGGMNYRLFQSGQDKNLWIYRIEYSEGFFESYTRLSAEGGLSPDTALSHSESPVEDRSVPEGWRMEESWSIENAPCTAEAFAAAIPTEAAQAAGLLMRNAEYYEYGDTVETPENAFRYPDGTAMPYDGAVAFLRRELGVEPTADVDEQAFFASLPRLFNFASGVGGWSTELYMKPDGSFTGSYHDSDMGDADKGYPNGTLYLCNFSGRFGDVKYVDDYTYSMRILTLEIDPMEEESIVDGVRYLASGPYGLENADEVLVYLPGSVMTKLPWPFVSWISAPHAWPSEERPLFLPFYGLYNVENREGWFSEDGLSVSWAEDTLSGYSEFDTFTAEQGSPQAKVLVCANVPVTNLRILSLSVRDITEYGRMLFDVKELGVRESLTPERPLVVDTVFHGDSPSLGFAYTDVSGAEHTVAVDVSGYDGSLYLFEFYD
ncbi:MAG: hypothetical protein E7425_10210 [Ruminococcaceae bacterium]|nr:hypothetical protein [Oscillospiraceae bacterium]